MASTPDLEAWARRTLARLDELCPACQAIIGVPDPAPADSDTEEIMPAPTISSRLWSPPDILCPVPVKAQPAPPSISEPQKQPAEDVSRDLEEPSRKKRVRMPNFTAEEDLVILSMCSIAEKQPPASIFAGALKDRTPAQCLQRWKNIKRIQLKHC